MSKTVNKAVEEEVDIDDYDLQDEIEDGDYGFVIGADGELKSMFAPEEFYLDPPAKVKKILKILGIKDINAYWGADDTLH